MTRIEIGSEIGSGGFCSVHEAFAVDENGDRLGSPLAIKRLQPRWLTDETVRRRFEREARLLHDVLDHPHIVSVVYRNVSGDEPMFVMPLADNSVADLLDSKAGNEDWVVLIFKQVLQAMAYAHGKGVIHRDLKPENLLLQDGALRVTDFGLGKALEGGTSGLTKTQVWSGTEPYMAPEQFTDMNKVGPEADVFSLGKLLMQMLSGTPPEVGAPDTSELPERFRYFISRCCEKKPENRFSDAGEALEQFARTTDQAFTELPAGTLQRLIEAWFAAPTGDDLEATREIDQLLRSHGREEALFTREVPRLPVDIVHQYLDDLGDAFVEMLRIYDGHVAGGLPFNYCDVVTDFYEDIYRRTSRLDLRELILRRLLNLGHIHDRWHARERILVLLSEVVDHSTVAMAADVLTDQPKDARWAGTVAGRFTLPKPIYLAFEGGS